MGINKTSGSLHITKKVDYGLFLLATLAEEEKAHKSIKVIADEHNISFPFLQKVARLLQQAGLIKAIRGKYGGYKLEKPAKKISLKEVIEALDGAISLTPCLKADADHKDCQRIAYCRIRRGLRDINEEIKNKYLKTTLDHIIT